MCHSMVPPIVDVCVCSHSLKTRFIHSFSFIIIFVCVELHLQKNSQWNIHKHLNREREREKSENYQMISSILCVLTQYVHIAVAYIWNTLSFSIIPLCSVRAIITIYVFFFFIVVFAAATTTVVVIFFLVFCALCYATAADPSWTHTPWTDSSVYGIKKKKNAYSSARN